MLVRKCFRLDPTEEFKKLLLDSGHHPHALFFSLGGGARQAHRKRTTSDVMVQGLVRISTVDCNTKLMHWAGIGNVMHKYYASPLDAYEMCAEEFVGLQQPFRVTQKKTQKKGSCGGAHQLSLDMPLFHPWWTVTFPCPMNLASSTIDSDEVLRRWKVEGKFKVG